MATLLMPSIHFHDARDLDHCYDPNSADVSNNSCVNAGKSR